MRRPASYLVFVLVLVRFQLSTQEELQVVFSSFGLDGLRCCSCRRRRCRCCCCCFIEVEDARPPSRMPANNNRNWMSSDSFLPESTEKQKKNFSYCRSFYILWFHQVSTSRQYIDTSTFSIQPSCFPFYPDLDRVSLACLRFSVFNSTLKEN